MSTAPTPKRGEIWQVDFDPSVGAEIRKVLPAVVMTVTGIGRLPLHIVVPLTDWKPHSVSNGRFVRRLGVVTDPQLDTIASVAALCVGAT